MARGCAVDRDGNTTALQNAYGQLALHSGKRHGDPVFACEEWLSREFADDPFEFLLRGNLAHLRAGHATLGEGNRPRRVAPHPSEQGQHIGMRNIKDARHHADGIIVFGQQVDQPRSKHRPAPWLGAERHGCRERKGTVLRQPCRIIAELRGGAFARDDLADRITLIEQLHGSSAHKGGSMEPEDFGPSENRPSIRMPSASAAARAGAR